MARRNLLCIVMGHKWSRQRLPNRTVKLTCKRCGDMDTVEKDMEPPLGMPGGPNYG
jgi:hypothetical protein